MKNFFLPSLLALAGGWGMTACSSDEPSARSIEITAEESRSITSQNLLGFKLLAATDELKNTAVSPLSVSMTLSMFANGASGETLSEFMDLLEAEDLATLNATNKKLLANLPRLDSKVKFSCANALWADPSIGVKSDFKSVLAGNYNASVFEESLTSDKLLDRINGFVSSKTSGMIPKILDRLAEGTSVAGVNAVYFKGDWSKKFDKKRTEKESFYSFGTQNCPVEMMSTSYYEDCHFTYLNNEKMSGVVLPYGNGSYDMTLLEVKDGIDFNEAVASLANGEFPQSQGEVKGVTMPKFSIGYNGDFVSILKGLGLERVFDRNSAELPNLSSAHCYLTQVQHAVRIELAEEGTVAAAATVGTGAATSLGPDGKWFRFDHPFIFYVTERSSGAILFVGKVVKLF